MHACMCDMYYMLPLLPASVLLQKLTFLHARSFYKDHRVDDAAMHVGESFVNT